MAERITVGVDIRDLRIATTGTKTYLEELCKQFKAKPSDIVFHFFDTFLPVYTGNNRFLKAAEHIRFFFWKQFTLPLKAVFSGCNIVFCTDYIVPYFTPGFKTIPVFHDAFFWEYPEHYNKYWLRLFRNMTLICASNSPFIIVPSEYAKKQLVKFTGFQESKFTVIYEGIKTFDSNSKIKTIENDLISLPPKYLLHIGSFDKRKNLPFLITTFKKMKEEGYSDLKLVLAGKSSSKSKSNDTNRILDSIQQNNLEKEVIVTGYVTEKQAALLYENAFLYVFPSVNEGFGLPVVEAFSKRIPVLVANNTCLPEIGGDAVIQFDPFDSNSLLSKLTMLANTPSIREELSEKGYARSLIFSWEKAAAEIKALFIKASLK